MRQQHGLRSLVIFCGLFSAVLHAADPVPYAQRFTPGQPSAFTTSSNGVRSPSSGTAAPASRSGQRAAPSFAERVRTVQQQQQQQPQSPQSDEDRPKPTNWQLQNPANPTNHLLTSLTGPIAPNNYFGNQFHPWSNMSQPTSMTQLPPTQTAVPPLNQTNAYTAPNNYFGGEFSSWSNLSHAQPEPNTFGGWNWRR